MDRLDSCAIINAKQGGNMRKIMRFEAYLDNYSTINAYLKSSHYLGESSKFYLRDQNGTLTRLTILNKETSDDYQKYLLEVPSIEIILGQQYDVIEEHGLTTQLQFGLIVRTNRFNDEFYNPRKDFGAHVLDGKTKFVLWAPTAHQVILQLYFDDIPTHFRMNKVEKGAWEVEINENLHGKSYMYLVNVNGSVQAALDPYGYGSIENSKRSAVIDFNQLKINMNDDKLPHFKHKTNAVIGEISVRDFSMDPDTNIKHKGQFLGLIEEGRVDKNGYPVGFDYLKSLGYTHVQLMPIYDFATTDELNPSLMYNWGYDPVQYNALEGSYSSDPTNPLTRIEEFLQVVSTYHRHGLRVTMDVVYNHMYDMENSAFEKIVPYYYFRLGGDGTISNGSFCGNDVDSSNGMVRKFIVDSILHYTKHYHIDGFRFDLMGILDIETMNTIALEVALLRPDAMIYGEGWNMPTMLKPQKRASMFNMHLMPEIGFFNDFYRDHIKGPSASDHAHISGYALGDTSYIETAKASLVGNTMDSLMVKLFSQPAQSVNYVECHDNATLWDKITSANPYDNLEQKIEKQKLTNGLLAVSQGILFLHYGQEMARTKNGIDNSYMSPDSINQVTYAQTETFSQIVSYTKDMIKLRKQLGIFSFNTAVEIKEHIHFENLKNKGLLMVIDNVSHYCGYDQVRVYVNPSYEPIKYKLNHEYKLLANEKGLANKEVISEVLVKPHSMMIVAN